MPHKLTPEIIRQAKAKEAAKHERAVAFDQTIAKLLKDATFEDLGVLQVACDLKAKAKATEA